MSEDAKADLRIALGAFAIVVPGLCLGVLAIGFIFATGDCWVHERRPLVPCIRRTAAACIEPLGRIFDAP